MKRRRKQTQQQGRRAGAAGAAVLLLAAGTAGCGTGAASRQTLDIPETPPVSAEKRWAVVQPAYQVLREQPRKDSPSLFTLRRGDILEVLSQTDWQEERKGVRGNWIRGEHGEEAGWVFEGDLRLYVHRRQAENASSRLE